MINSWHDQIRRLDRRDILINDFAYTMQITVRFNLDIHSTINLVGFLFRRFLNSSGNDSLDGISPSTLDKGSMSVNLTKAQDCLSTLPTERALYTQL